MKVKKIFSIRNLVFCLLAIMLVSMVTVLLFARDKTADESVVIEDAQCTFADGKIVSAVGHSGNWISLSSNYERYVCSVCGDVKKREKNTVIDFEDGVIINTAKKFSVIVGSLVGTGNPSVPITTGSTLGGNARDWFELTENETNKVLKVVGQNISDYSGSKIRVSLTDRLHSANTGDGGGKYLVFEFDAMFDFNARNNSDVIFALRILDDNNNYIGSTPVYSYGDKVKIGTTELDYVANGKKWLSFKVVTELATETDPSGAGESVTKIYYSERGAEGPMRYITTVTRNSPYGTVNRTDAHVAELLIGENISRYTYYLDNFSFIRTNDAKYFE